MTNRVRVCVAALAAVVWAEHGVAQASALAPICPAGSAPVIVSSDALVGLAPATEYRGFQLTEAQRRQERWYAAAIRKHFIAPAPHGPLAVLESVQPAPFDKASRGPLGANVRVILRPDGRVERLAWQYLPLGEPLESALRQAASDANDAGEFADSAATWGAGRLDTVVLIVQTSARDEDIVEPLTYLRIPSYRADQLPRASRMESPVYPRDAQRDEIEAQVDATFVIGSDGKMLPETLRFTRAGRVVFIEPVRRVLLDAEFRAGTSGGCRVPSTVRQSFQFKMEP